ncbi:uncharacterized protein LOC142574772 [Dermacentor variabilis]|uniref:uncharacterized protein LOC142574772 n=1 Tax=Dermacentor variabilis TaxID=34621 RepID=UPI003F5AE20E
MMVATRRSSCHLGQAGVSAAHRGWALREGYVNNIKLNVNTADPAFGLIRATCTPSMKSGVYVVTAWFAKATGDIAGAHCECVVGLSETCQHVAGLLLSVAELGDKEMEIACTDQPCKWIVPAEAKKPAPRLPLVEISFRKYEVNRPLHQKRKRRYNPCGHLSPPTENQVQRLEESLSECCPSLQAVRYMGQPAQQHVPEPSVELIGDEEDLWSDRVQELVNAHMSSLKPIEKDEREGIRANAIGQADNKNWHVARLGRLTASLFKQVCRCVKPESLLKTLLYPSERAASTEAMVYGRVHEKDAVGAYALLRRSLDRQVTLQETGLHIYSAHPLLAASPDRVVTVDGEEGILEVKCPFSKQGQCIKEACKDKKLCCRLEDGMAVLKTDHEYYIQIQGQLAITGHNWCDFVVWFGPNKIHLQRIHYNKVFWETEVLPSLLHFMRHALIPEILTRRVKRLNKLYTKGQYVSHKKLLNGFFVCDHHGSLVMTIRRIVDKKGILDARAM